MGSCYSLTLFGIVLSAAVVLSGSTVDALSLRKCKSHSILTQINLICAQFA